MKKLISFSVKHPVSVIMLTIALVMCSFICIFSINTDFLPVISSRYILICTKFPGITPHEIEEMVTIPAEESFSSLKGIKKIESVSRDSLSVITIELKWGTDIDLALIQCREIADLLYPSLPFGCEKPEIIEKSQQKDTISIAMIPADGDLIKAQRICQNEIKPIIQKISGVSTVKIIGGQKEQIEIIAGKDELEARNITLQELSDIIACTNFEYPAGTITEGENDISIKTDGLFKNLEEISKTPLQFNLELGSFAKVKKGLKKQNSFFLMNGKECIQIAVQKRNEANPIKVSKAVKSELEELKNTSLRDFNFQIIEDYSENLTSSLKQLFISALISFFITFTIVFLFFKSIMLSLLLSSIIPLTGLCSILSLYFTGNSINIMSVSGIAIGIGMVIDCCAVSLENILEKQAEGVQIIDAVHEISSSNLGSSFTTILVFIPIFFIKGLTEEIFASMSIAIISSIFYSCFFSFTFIPAVCVILTRKQKYKSIYKRNNLISAGKYEKLLSYFFSNKKILFVICMLCFLAGFTALKSLEFSIFPESAANSIETEIILPADFSIQMMKSESEKIFTKIKKEISSEIIKSLSICGGTEEDNFQQLGRPETSKNQLRVKITLTDIAKSKVENLKSELEDFFEKYEYKATFCITGNPVVEILNLNERKYVITESLRSSLSKNKYLQKNSSNNFSIIPDSYRTQFVFTPDRISSSRFSLSALYTASIIKNAIDGIESCNYYENGKAIPIVVKFQDEQIKDIRDLESLSVKLENQRVQMKILGKFSEEIQENVLYRYNKKYAKILKPENSSQDNLFEKDEKLINLQKLQNEELWGDSTILLFTVFLLLYLILGAQFESFSIPLLLLLTLPPAFSGAFIFLSIFGKSIDINALVAMVTLFGTVVNNSIILYEKCRQQIKSAELNSLNRNFIVTEGEHFYRKQIIIKSCSAKMRVLVLTNGTTICSLIPFAIDINNSGGQASIAITIIGGMTVSLLVSIFVIPVFLAKHFKSIADKSAEAEA